MRTLALACALALSACATTTTISSSPTSILPGNVQTDLSAARAAADQAVAAGLLPATDPVAACLDSFVPNPACSTATPPTGCPPAAQTFTQSGLVSEGVVLYVQAQQLKASTVSPSCEQLIGHIMVQAAKAGVVVH